MTKLLAKRGNQEQKTVEAYCSAQQLIVLDAQIRSFQILNTALRAIINFPANVLVD